jgi:hypothetical protein
VDSRRGSGAKGVDGCGKCGGLAIQTTVPPTSWPDLGICAVTIFWKGTLVIWFAADCRVRMGVLPKQFLIVVSLAYGLLRA